MHELSIAQDLFRIVEDKAKENNLKAVTKIVVVIGEASGIEKDFLRHSIVDHLMPDSIAEKAELEIRKEPLRARCQICGIEIDCRELSSLSCPECGGNSLEILQGKDVYLKAIEGE